MKQVRRDLGVRYVLKGSVRRQATWRVTGQLIDAESGAHVWADRFDRDLTDIFAVQDELTQKIVSALALTLTRASNVGLQASPRTTQRLTTFSCAGATLVSANKGAHVKAMEMLRALSSWIRLRSRLRLPRHRAHARLFELAERITVALLGARTRCGAASGSSKRP